MEDKISPPVVVGVEQIQAQIEAPVPPDLLIERERHRKEHEENLKKIRERHRKEMEEFENTIKTEMEKSHTGDVVHIVGMELAKDIQEHDSNIT